jgi:hypothetical protein
MMNGQAYGPIGGQSKRGFALIILFRFLMTIEVTFGRLGWAAFHLMIHL